MVSFNDILNNPEIKTYIVAADRSLCAIGYTEHSFAHVGRVSEVTAEILEKLGHNERMVELGRIAGYLQRRRDHRTGEDPFRRVIAADEP